MRGGRAETPCQLLQILENGVLMRERPWTYKQKYQNCGSLNSYFCSFDKPPSLAFRRMEIWIFFIPVWVLGSIYRLIGFKLFIKSTTTSFFLRKTNFPSFKFWFFCLRWVIRAEAPIFWNCKNWTKTRAETAVSCFWGSKVSHPTQ